MIRVLLVDDHEIVRRGVRDLLEAGGEIEVVGEAGTAVEAVAAAEATRPDVAVLDVRLPDGSGVEVCREVRSRQPEARCLMLTSWSDDEALADAVLAGAHGYLLKEIRGTDLVDAVRRVAAGESLMDPRRCEEVQQRLRAAAEREERTKLLTAQERRILDCLADGMTNRQIAETMFLAEKTVKNYVSNVLGKLGMARRTEAAVYAARRQERRSFDT